MLQPASASGIGRRRFLTSLAVLMGGGVATLVGAAEGAKADDTVTLWRLNASWGYPVAPKGKTHCECNACQLHAANKIFLSSAAAVASRIHPCCVCQPESFVVPVSCVGALFASSPDSSGQMTDRRYDGVAAALSSCFAAPPPDAGPTTTASGPTTTASGPTTTAPGPGAPASGAGPTASPAQEPTATGTRNVATASPAPAAPAQPLADAAAEEDETLPVTGFDVKPLVVAAGALTAAGAVAAAVARPGDTT
jgi:hypothetical protein